MEHDEIICPECKGSKHVPGDPIVRENGSEIPRSKRCPLCDGKGYTTWDRFAAFSKRRKGQG